MQKEMGEEVVAVKLANYVLDQPSNDPDGDICILARQFLRKRETIRSIVAASAGGHVFVPSSAIGKGNDPRAELVVHYDAEKHGYHIQLVHG